MISLKTFLSTVYGQKQRNEVVCVTHPVHKVVDGKQMFNRKTGEPETTFRNYRERSHEFQDFSRGELDHDEIIHNSWYMCISTVRSPEDGYVRRRLEDCLFTYCVVLDDIGTKVDAGVVPVDPTWKIETSPGNYQFGYVIDPDDRLSRVSAVISAIVDRGWGDPGAKGASRVVRIPGSVNAKPQNDGWAAVIADGDWHPSRFWSLDGLMEAFGISEHDLDVKKTKQKRVIEDGNIVEQNIVDPLFEWMQGYTFPDGSPLVLSFDGEWAQIRCFKLEEGIEAGFHTSNDYASYSPLGCGGEKYEMFRAFSCLHGAHKDELRFRDFMGWALELGAPIVSGYDPVAFLQQRFMIVLDDRPRVVDTVNRAAGGKWSYEKAAWLLKYPEQVAAPTESSPKRTIAASNAFLNDPETLRVTRELYYPELPDAMLVPDGTEVALNGYTRPLHPETAASPDVFLDHVDLLCPSDAERDIFLDWLAYKLQYPASRSFGVIMVAEGFGVGRSWLRDMFSRVWGGAVVTVPIEEMVGEGKTAYNEWMSRSQIVVVEEAKSVLDGMPGNKAYEKLKTLIDTRVGDASINNKYGAKNRESVYFNAIVMSQHFDAISLEPDDRRFYVITNPVERETFEYYDQLEGSLVSEAAAVYWYLMRRDVSAFNHVYPPMTPGKEKMLDQAISPFDACCQYVRENAPGSMTTREQLKSLVRIAARKTGFDELISGKVLDQTAGRLWKDLGRLGAGVNGYRMRVDDKQTPVRQIYAKYTAHTHKKAPVLYEQWVRNEVAKNAAGLVGKDAVSEK